MSGISSIGKTKEAITGMSLGAVALLIIVTFVYPSLTDQDKAIGELQIQDAIQHTNLSNLINSNMIISENQSEMDKKLDKIMLIICHQSESSLCY